MIPYISGEMTRALAEGLGLVKSDPTLQDRALVSEVQNQYAYSARDGRRVPLQQIAATDLTSETGVLRQFNRSRAITISCYPLSGELASTVLDAAMPQIEKMSARLPPGYSFVFAGEYKA